jgi:hypothetical protein
MAAQDLRTAHIVRTILEATGDQALQITATYTRMAVSGTKEWYSKERNTLKHHRTRKVEYYKRNLHNNTATQVGNRHNSHVQLEYSS